jgi:CBS domain-containing protein
MSCQYPALRAGTRVTDESRVTPPPGDFVPWGGCEVLLIGHEEGDDRDSSEGDGDGSDSRRTGARWGYRQSPVDEEVWTMTTAREIMTEDAECARANEMLDDAARKMRDLGVGALPICGEDDRLQGVITDRDIVVRCVAEGGDPASTPVTELAEGKPVTIGADDPVDLALRTMIEHGVRRLPVIDGDRLVGMVSQADVARETTPEQAGELVAALSRASDNN